MNKIICPTDFSECAENAIYYAFELARKSQSGLVLVHAYQIPYMESEEEKNRYRNSISEELDSIRDELEIICRRLAGANDGKKVEVEFTVREGLVQDIIGGLVKEKHADLVVVGTKGAEGFREVMGTMAATMIDKAGCPVMIIPEVSIYKSLDQVVYATDLSGDESAAVEYAVGLASLHQAHISFLSIQKQDDRQTEVDKVMKYAFDKLLHKTDYDDMSFHLNEGADILESISEFAEKKNADLVVMATHERSAFEKLYSKSMSKQMAYHAEVPLLILQKLLVSKYEMVE